MVKFWWVKAEEFLGTLPRIVLLAVTVLVMRAPLVQGPLAGWTWWGKLPVELVLVLLFNLAAAAAWKVVRHDPTEAAVAPAAPGPGAAPGADGTPLG
jgi:hypothetical protein